MTEKRSRRAFDAAFKLQVVRIPASAGHPRQVNLVVFEKQSGRPLQALRTRPAKRRDQALNRTIPDPPQAALSRSPAS